MKQKKYFTVHNIALVGILAAMIFVLTKFVSVPIPSPLGKTALSVGNAMCILSALLFGPLTGGLAAGVGNALVDLLDPAWASQFWITFINKFLMAFVAGLVMHKVKLGKENVRIWFAGLAGAVTYCVLYVTKNIIEGVFVRGFTWEVTIVETLTTKVPVTLTNGVIAVVCAGLLYVILKQPLQKAHVLTGSV
ncbi:MAG: ECF transporter S component [Oscillibacter sp.]|nr:ECF transporter S component [Oscillibacter sp.]